jgi:hypothetical protein
MMSLDAIHAINDEKAEEARMEGKTPFVVVSPASILPPFPFPHIGSYRPSGWNLIETYFVDSSGFGSEGEAAMTVEEFMDAIKPNHGYAIIEAGQFQVRVGEFVKEG